jgi:hypothetical protein
LTAWRDGLREAGQQRFFDIGVEGFRTADYRLLKPNTGYYRLPAKKRGA